MDLSNSYTQASAPRPAVIAPPLPRPDLRPTADAAALARDAQPKLPMAIPPSNSQIGEVSKTILAASPKEEERDSLSSDQASEVSRTLKPYGIAMLPGPVDGASKPRGSDTQGAV